MLNGEKQLLIEDLCARLPYGVRIKHMPTGMVGKLNDISLTHYYNNTNSIQDINALIRFFGDDYTNVENFKPYLRPLSSMTEKEKEEYNQVFDIELKYLSESEDCGHTIDSAAGSAFTIDFYNRYHFDYRGLIEKGLALEAPEDMYKEE